MSVSITVICACANRSKEISRHVNLRDESHLCPPPPHPVPPHAVVEPVVENLKKQFQNAKKAIEFQRKTTVVLFFRWTEN